MNIRLLLLLLLSLFGVLVGTWWGQSTGALIGGFIGVAAWYFGDDRQGQLVLQWLFRPRRSRAPKVLGFWQQQVEAVLREVKRLNAKVKDREVQLNNFLEAIQESPNGVMLLDRSGMIEWCNHTAAVHFEIDAKRDRWQYIGNLLRDPNFLRYYHKEDYSHDAIVPGPSDSLTHPSQLQVQLHRYSNGRKLLLSRDVTVLQQVEIMRRDFIANVSHEIKTPLTVLVGFIETMQSGHSSPDEQRTCLGLMEQQAQRLETLVEDLLTLSKLEGSPLPDPNTWVSLRSLMSVCEKEAYSLSQVWSQNMQILTFEYPDQDYYIRGVEAELHSAMQNLLSNAIRYTQSDGVIKAGWSKNAQGGLTFSVRDNGIGIASKDLSKLTQRFYRVDQSRSQETGGTGLGLAIVKQIMQRHSAELGISSVFGKGSTFSMIFPVSCVGLGETSPEDKANATRTQ